MSTPKRKLAPKQRRFVNEYLIDLNATQAAVRAGYSEKTAYSMGQRLLKNVEIQEAIRKAQDDQQRRTQITADEVIREMFRVATFDPRKLFKPDGTLKKMTELDDDTAACIGGMDVIEHGSGETFEIIRKIKIWDKNTALEKLGKYFRLFVDRVEQTGKDGGPIEHEHAHKLSAAAKEMVERILAPGDDGEDNGKG